MTDAIIGAAIALVLVAAALASGLVALGRRALRWLVREFHL